MDRPITETSSIFFDFLAMKQPSGLLDGSVLLGAEVVHRDYPIDDAQWSSNLFGSAGHPMRVAKEILEIGPVHIGREPVSFGQQVWRGTSGIPVRLQPDAGDDCRVIGFYQKDKNIIGVEFNFDVVQSDGVTDTLQIQDLGDKDKLMRLAATSPRSSDFGASLAESSEVSLASRVLWMMTRMAFEVLPPGPAAGAGGNYTPANPA